MHITPPRVRAADGAGRWAEPDPEGLPKFANHAGHLRRVLAEGGFGALTERRVGGALIVGLPILYPYGGPKCPA